MDEIGDETGDTGKSTIWLQIRCRSSQNRVGRGRPWFPGQSGIRAAGCPARRTAQRHLDLDGEAERLTRQAIQTALDGSVLALRLCLERIIAPRRVERARFEMPPLDTADDAARALAAIAAAASRGELSASEAHDLAAVVVGFIHVMGAREFEQRLGALEAGEPAKGPYG